MARVWQCGWELNSLTSGVEINAINTGPFSIVTTIVRSGTYSLHATGFTGTGQNIRQTLYAANQTIPIYVRIYYFVAAYPTATRRIFYLADITSTARVAVNMTSAGKLQIWDSGSSSQVGSDSAVLNLGTWYQIELKADFTVLATTACELKINGVSQTTGNVNANTGAGRLLMGCDGADANFDYYLDDVAVNDNTGSFQTSYPGSGKIIHLLPNAAGDINGFAVQVGGTAGSGNNFTRVSEVSPDDATTYNGSAILSSEDLFNCGDSPNLISSDDTINVVAVGVRMSDLVGADATAAFKLEIEKTTGGTKTQSGTLIPNSTSWLTNAAAEPRNYPITTYQNPDAVAWTKATLDTMQIGYIQTATNVQTIAVSTVWASIDYTPLERAIGVYFPYKSL